MKVPNVRGQGAVSINMTPMIDVVFLLIIFFLVSSHLAKQENRVRLDLPEASTALDDAAEQRTVTINVFEDGTWRLGNSDPMIPSKLVSSLIVKNRETQGELRVRIRTDRNVTYSTIAPILKACAQAGTADVVFSVYEQKKKL